MTHIYWMLEFITLLTETFCGCLFCGSYIHRERCKEKIDVYILITLISSFIMLIVNSIKLYASGTAMIGMVLLVGSILIVHYKNLLKALVFGVLYVLMVIVDEGIVATAVAWISDIPVSEIFTNHNVYRAIGIITSKSLIVLIVVTVYRYNHTIDYLKKSTLIAMLASSGVFLIATTGIMFRDIAQNEENTFTNVMFYVVVFILVMMVFFGITRFADYYNDKQQLEMTQLRNEMLEQSIRSAEQNFNIWKRSLHDYKHNIINLTTLAEKNDIDGIKEYLEKERESLSHKFLYYKTGNDSVDAVLNVAKQETEKSKIIYMVNAKVPQDCKVASADFCTLLGNLLDNAREAAEKEQDPYIRVNIKQVKSYIVIVITNKFTGYNPQLKSTKLDKEFHGMGIKSVKQIVKKYDGEFVTEQDKDKFTVKVMLNNEKELSR